MIAYKLRQTYFIELEDGNILGLIIRNFEETWYKRTVTRLHFRANDGNATSQTFCYQWLVWKYDPTPN